MIKTVNTQKMIREYSDTKNAPISFLCEDQETYYAKYIQDPKEFDCLVYELVCNKIAECIGLKVPEAVFVNVSKNSLANSRIKNNGNLRFFKEGITAFGVNEIPYVDMVTNLPLINKKSDFKKINNPYDLISIAIFDMHIANKDRHPENFNLLLSKGKTRMIFAIDHYDTFGGLNYLGKINPNQYFSVDNTILRARFVQELILKYYDIHAVVDLVEKYAYICNPKQINALLNELFNQIPNTWQLSATLKDDMLALLTNTDRIRGIEESVLEFIQLIKKTY
jgi:hypothetical protein